MADKVRIKFLAAGNVYFEGPATVLHLSEQENFNFPTPYRMLSLKARKALQVVQEPTWDIVAFTKHEPSTSVGHIARAAEAIQFISGIAGLKEPGWHEISADTGVAGFPCGQNNRASFHDTCLEHSRRRERRGACKACTKNFLKRAGHGRGPSPRRH